MNRYFSNWTEIGLIVVIVLVRAAPVAQAGARADVIIYGDVMPAATLGGQPFELPLLSCDRSDDTQNCQASDVPTAIDFEVIPGLALPLGSTPWGFTAWGKYVIVGNFDPDVSGLDLSLTRANPVRIKDQALTIFDTESKTACQLDLDPNVMAVAGVQHVQVADPGSSVTRIYFQGFPTNSGIGYSFGYLEADLAAGDPCSDWPVVGFTGFDLNALAVDPSELPCLQSNGFCGFDGLEVVRQDETNGEVLALTGWWTRKIVAVRVTPAGTVSVESRPAGQWLDPGTGACIELQPVSEPAGNRLSSADDARWAVSYDKLCLKQGPTPPPECAPDVIAPCPTGTPGGTVCYANVASRCRETGAPCLENYGSILNSPPCTCRCGVGSPNQEFALTDDGIAPTSPLFLTQDATGSAPVLYDDFGALLVTRADPGGSPIVTIGDQVTSYIVDASGEHSYFDPEPYPVPEGPMASVTIAPASSFFFAEPPDNDFINESIQHGNRLFTNGQISVKGAFRYYSLWLAAGTETFAGADLLPSEARTCSVATPSCQNDADCTGDFTCFEPMSCSGNGAICFTTTDCEAGESCTSAGPKTCQPLGVGEPCLDACSTAGLTCIGSFFGQAVGLGKRSCQAIDQPCRVQADCPLGTCVSASPASGPALASDMALGGSPPSLWVSPRFRGNAEESLRRLGTNTYLSRLPVETSVPDSNTQSKPSVVWVDDETCSGSCARLWMFARREGSPWFRTRTNGLWGQWVAIPTSLSLEAGINPIYDGTSLELFARTSSGEVVSTTLQSSAGCVPTTCSWTPWSPVVADNEPQASLNIAVVHQTSGGFSGPLVVVRDATNGVITYTWRKNGVWTDWSAAVGVTTSLSPTIAFSDGPNGDGKVWLAVVETTSGEIRTGRFAADVFEGFDAPLAGPPSFSAVGLTGWFTPPALSWDGDRLRLFAPQAAFPQYVWQATYDGQWDTWGPISSGGKSIRQPAAETINGDVNLITSWYGFVVEQLAR